MEDEKLFNALADICKPVCNVTNLGKMYTPTEVKLLCIDAIIYYMEQVGRDKIDINEFFKQQGL